MNKNNVILPVVLILAAVLVVGGFVLLKKHKDSVAPTPVAVVEEVVEEPEPEVEEQPQPRRRQRRDVNASINRMMPVQGDQVQGMPTREEAVNAAWDILSAYREASPQEKQQMYMVMNMASYVVNGIAQNADQFIQRMTPEQRDQLLQAAGGSLDLLDAIQEEMMYDVTDEEIQVFGGVFQSMAAFLQVTAEEFSNLMALTQMTPGPIGVNGATYFGYRLAGVPGAVFASAALLLPGSVLAYFAFASLDRFRSSAIVRGILRGVRPASVALMLVALAAFAKMSVFDSSNHISAFAAILVVVSAAITLKRMLNPVFLIILCALAASLCA